MLVERVYHKTDLEVHVHHDVGHEQAQHQDDKQAEQEAEALMVLDEVYHADTIALCVKRTYLAQDKGPGPSLLSDKRSKGAYTSTNGS